MTNIEPNEKSIFLQAIEIATDEERAEYLQSACAGNEALRVELEALLRAHAKPQRILDAPDAGSPTLDQPITEKPGTQIGPYKLLQQLGEGGMGVVYMAEQKEPVKRRVALKIIKPGMDTRQVIARFEAERQALAMMDHPNIAKVLDAGATESGRPYFVMELVNGLPVTKYCDEQHLTPKERLELFVPICQAVQHAHQKGIIHRDLKPSNILVAMYDNKAVPKIIDFGVAKATSQTLTDKTMFTQLGQVVGTLEYMSPEQAQRNQLDIDTRSDIYSLGVVLYELLTGETPFDRERLRSAAFEEMLRIIREEEPSKPSTKVSSSQSLPSIAANRRIEPTKLGSMIRGELDWIVLKAMEKDRGRRYETATKFAEDVQHYLNDEAVVACPPSAAYRLRKFASRNRAAMLTASMVAMSLLLGTVVATWQAFRATEQRDRAFEAEQTARAQSERANAEAATVRAINDFINQDLLSQADPQHEADRDITLRVVLNRASKQIDNRFADEPLVKAALHHTLGTTYDSLGLSEEALKHLTEACAIFKRELGPEDPHTLVSLNNLALVYASRDRLKEAADLLRQVMDIQRRNLGEHHHDTLLSMNNLADLLRRQGCFKEAERLQQRALSIQDETLGQEHRETLLSLSNLAELQLLQGRYKDAETLAHRVLEIRRRTLGDDHPDTCASVDQLARILASQGRYEEAKDLFLHILEVKQNRLGKEHPHTLRTMHSLARLYLDRGQLEKAEEFAQLALEVQRTTLGEDHLDTLYGMSQLANVYLAESRYEEALELQRLVLEGRRGKLGEDHPRTLASIDDLARIHSRRGHYEEAEKLHAAVLEARRRTLGNEHPATLSSMNNLAGTLDDLGRYDEAELLHRKAIEIKRRVLGPEHPQTLVTMSNLANTLGHCRNYEEAESLFGEVLEISRRLLGPNHPSTLTRMQNLAVVLSEAGRYSDAERLSREVVEVRQRILGEGHHETLNSMLILALSLEHQERHHEAEQLFSEVFEGLYRTVGKGHPDTLCALIGLARMLRAQGRHREAENTYRQLTEILRAVRGPKDPQTLGWMRILADTIKQQGRYPEAEDIYREVFEAIRDTHPRTGQAISGLVRELESWAWQLASSSAAPTEDYLRALELAQRAAALDPQRAVAWQVLGWAHFRNGNWQESVDALKKSCELQEGGDPWQWLFMAMSHWQLGNQEEAGRWHQRSLSWLERRNEDVNAELRGFLTEAERLMSSRADERTDRGNQGE